MWFRHIHKGPNFKILLQKQMKPPIIIAAFGTTSKALTTYRQVDKHLRTLLPDRQIHWAYTSRIISKTLQQRDLSEIVMPEDLLSEFASQGIRKATVQSLHLLPGKEFHSLVRTAERSEVGCNIGLPILSTPGDYAQIAALLTPQIQAHPEQAILILGHGTFHPSWTCYLALETIMRRLFGSRIFVGALEQYPDSSRLPILIREAGYNSVCIIPFLMVAGMHFHRDIKGTNENSWERRLRRENIDLEICGEGLGRLPGIAHVVRDHILSAEASR